MARRLLWLLVLVLALAPEIEAQKKRGRKRGGNAEAPAAPKAKAAPSGPLYLPGTKPEPEANGKSPKTDAKAKTVRPANPLAAADEITRAEDYRNRASEGQTRFLQEHFAVCDLDGNGWLSLREAEVTLSFDRVEYRRADANQDGGLELAEFTAQETLLLARLGAAPDVGLADPAPEPLYSPEFVGPPLPGEDATLPGPELPPDEAARDASQESLMPADAGDEALAPRSGSHFGWLDASTDGFIDENELRAVLSPVTLDLRLRSMISGMDRDGDGRLSEDEFHRAMIPGSP